MLCDNWQITWIILIWRWVSIYQMIASEFELVNYVGIDSSHCGCIMRTTRGLLYSCELARYVLDSIPLDTIHMFWWRLSFSEQCLFEPEVNIIEEMEAISKQFEELDVYGKVTLKSKLLEISYPDLNFVCAPPEKVKTKRCSKETDEQTTKINKSWSVLLGVCGCIIFSAI